MIHFHIHKKPHTTAGRVVLPMLAFVLLFLTGCINRQLDETVAVEARGSLSREVYERIERVMEHREAGELAEAQRLLDELEVRLDNGELNNWETQVVWQFQANLAQINSDWELAHHYYGKILELPTLSSEHRAQSLNQIGALSFMQEDYPSAIGYFLQLLEIEPEADQRRSVHLRLSYAYYQLEQWEEALSHAESSRTLGNNARNTLALLKDLYEKTGQTNKASELAAAIANLPPSAEVIVEEDVTASDEYLPIVVIQPQYPNRALQEGIEGWAQVSFTVDEAGSVVDPVIVQSSPEEVFDEASLAAVSRFKFNPRVVDGQAVQTPDVRYVFRYNLSE